MPFLIYVCKNPTPHKTQIFVPATAMGSNNPGASGGNLGAVTGGFAGAVITCPKCAFTAQPGDGNSGSVANGAQLNQQEASIGNQNVAGTDQGVQVAPVIAGTADSAVRLTASGGGVGNPGGSAILGQGSTQYNLNQSGVKNLQ